MKKFNWKNYKSPTVMTGFKFSLPTPRNQNGTDNTYDCGI